MHEVYQKYTEIDYCLNVSDYEEMKDCNDVCGEVWS